MLKALVKKELLHVYAMLSTSKRTGGRMSPVGFALLWAFIFIAVGASIFGMGSFVYDTVIPYDMPWLYFSSMGIMTLVLSVFGNVFTSYSALYKAKDNDLLFSMPIPPFKILLSRLLSVYLLGSLYAFFVWVPTILVYEINAGFSLPHLLILVLMFIVLSAIALVLTCILGFVVALVTGIVHNKTVTSLLLSLLILGIYYVCYFKINDYMQSFAANVESIRDAISGSSNPIFVFGLACMGRPIPLLGVVLVTLVILSLCVLIMSKTFINIATKNIGEKKSKYKEKTLKTSSIKTSLVKRELKRFVSSSTYILNAGIGLIFLIALTVLAIINAGQIRALVEMLIVSCAINIDSYEALASVGTVTTVCLLVSTCAISAPSVSLEGKTLWILRSLPIDSKDVLKTKVIYQVILVIVPALFAAISLCVILRISLILSIVTVIGVLAYVVLSAYAGVYFGTKHAILTWTNEVVPIKQCMAVVICFFGGWALSIVIGGVFAIMTFALDLVINPYIYIALVIASITALSALIHKWINNSGTLTFEGLEA